MSIAIDEPDQRGGEPGAWMTAIAPTPALRDRRDAGPDAVDDDFVPLTDTDIPY